MDPVTIVTLAIPGTVYRECIDGWEVVSEAGWPTPRHARRGRGSRYTYGALRSDVRDHIVQHVGDLCAAWIGQADGRGVYYAGLTWARVNGYKG